MTVDMVPLAAPFANSKAFQGSSSRSHMLSLSSSFPQNSFCRSQNVVNGFVPAGVHAENELRLSHWLESAKKANDLAKSRQDSDSECPKVGAESVTESSGIGAESDGHRKDASPAKQSLNGCKASCQALTQMNGADDFRMTGSSNPRADQLNWLADVATGAAAAAAAAVARAPQNSSPTVEGSEKGSSRPPAHLQGSDAMTPRSSFGSVLLGVGPMSQRMYPSQYHLEHFHPTSATAGSALSLYYSQAPRSAAYAGFYQADPRLQYCSSVTDGLVSPRMPRPYFQGELYPPAMASIPGVQLQNARVPLPHSPSYLHQAASLSPVGPGSPTPPHARMSTVQATGLLHSRSPEEITPPDKGRLSLPTASNSTHYHHPEDAKRPSYSSPEPKTQSPVGERLATSPYLSDYQGSKDMAARQNASPSHVAYKIPTGKEGSLKHRILRPPSINIVDPPPVAHDAPLSAPPIRSHREPSPKQVRQDGYSSYRSFSTSGSFLLDGGHVAPSTSQGTAAAAAFGVPTCTLPSAAAVDATAACIAAPQGVRSDCSSQLKYPPAFMKGSIIQLANSQLKPVEDMTTEDFLECEAMSPNLKIDSSTVISIEKMPVSGSAKLGFSVGEKKFQITVEAPLEHPFFVYRQGWSSCCPERSMLRYGLNCHKLKVGDTCIFLTVKSELPCQPVSQNCVPSPKPPVLVPTANAALSAPKKPQESVLQPSVVGIPSTADSGHLAMAAKSSTVSANNNNNNVEGTPVQKEAPSVPSSLQQKISMLFSENSNSNDGNTPPPKRKRRWSFPGRLSSSSPPSSSATKN